MSTTVLVGSCICCHCPDVLKGGKIYRPTEQRGPGEQTSCPTLPRIQLFHNTTPRRTHTREIHNHDKRPPPRALVACDAHAHVRVHGVCVWRSSLRTVSRAPLGLMADEQGHGLVWLTPSAAVLSSHVWHAECPGKVGAGDEPQVNDELL